MKPWEEEWRLAREGSRTMLCGPDPYPAADFYGSEGDARILLAAAAPEMARMLLELEWSGDEARYRCPACEATAHPNHAPDCRLVAVLRKAGVLT